MLNRLRTFLWLFRVPVDADPETGRIYRMCLSASWELSGDSAFLHDPTCKRPRIRELPKGAIDG